MKKLLRTKAIWQDVWWGLFSEGLAAARFTCGEILRLKTHGTSIVQKWPRLRRRRHCSACGCRESASGDGMELAAVGGSNGDGIEQAATRFLEVGTSFTSPDRQVQLCTVVEFQV